MHRPDLKGEAHACFFLTPRLHRLASNGLHKERFISIHKGSAGGRLQALAWSKDEKVNVFEMLLAFSSLRERAAVAPGITSPVKAGRSRYECLSLVRRASAFQKFLQNNISLPIPGHSSPRLQRRLDQGEPGWLDRRGVGTGPWGADRGVHRGFSGT
uniref:Uncharacterized protein n=1 Tax=Pipistrellus kuhlii TaxID=59472 RepID=A0A7J7WD42_PIPKU|nr:hypothetical protein mPipKuh1_008027 [Pipistrellus kuhlii]